MVASGLHLQGLEEDNGLSQCHLPRYAQRPEARPVVAISMEHPEQAGASAADCRVKTVHQEAETSDFGHNIQPTSDCASMAAHPQGNLELEVCLQWEISRSPQMEHVQLPLGHS